MPSVATGLADLTVSQRTPQSFEGVITQAPCFPWDNGKVWTTDKHQDMQRLPFSLSLAVHFQPDDDEAFISYTGLTFQGGLRYFIAATNNVDHDGDVSDIKYPGDPSAPDGLNMQRMHDALHEIWSRVNSDVVLYQAACLETYGGSQPFNIGRKTIGLPKHSNWEFFLETAMKSQPYKDALVAKFQGKRAPNPDAMFTGVRGEFERMDVPSYDRKSSAMKEEQKDKKPFQIHVMTRFDEYDDAGSVAAGAKSTTPPVSSESSGDIKSQFRDALDEALIESDEGKLTAEDIKKVYLQPEFKANRKTLIPLKRSADFLNSTDGTWYVEEGELRL